MCGETVRFTATAEDAQGVPIGGVEVTWRGREVGSGQEARFVSFGEFVADEPGTYTIVAEAAGQQAEATVTAIPAKGPESKTGEQPVAEDADDGRVVPLAPSDSNAGSNAEAGTAKRDTERDSEQRCSSDLAGMGCRDDTGGL